MSIYDRDYLRADRGGSSAFVSSPPRTSAVPFLIGVNLAVFLLWQLSYRPGFSPFYGGFSPWIWAHFAVSPVGVLEHFYGHTLITHAFSHGALSWLVVNLLFIWWFGRELERQNFGSANLIVLYLGAAVMGGLCHVMLGDMRQPGAIGAFGPVLAMASVLALTNPQTPVTIVFGAFVLPVGVRVLIYGAIEAISVFTRPSLGQTATQVAGLAAGLLLVRPRWRPFTHDNRWRWRRELAAGISKPVVLSPDDAWLREALESDAPPARSAERHVDAQPDPARREDVKPAAPNTPKIDEQTEARLDQLLKKISETGLASLTPEEREFMQQASRRYRD